MSDARPNELMGLDPVGLRARYQETFGGKQVFLREVLQNAVQAVRLRGEAAGRVDVTFDRAEKVLEIRDNGVGMSASKARAAVSRYFGSEWNTPTATEESFAERMRRVLHAMHDGSNTDVATLIASLSDVEQQNVGRFGVGLTTCIMVADRYEVTTRSRDDPNCSRHVVYIERQGRPALRYRYELLAPSNPNHLSDAGTVVRIHLGVRSDADHPPAIEAQFLDPSYLKLEIQRYMALVEVPIFLEGELLCGGQPTPDVLGPTFYGGEDGDDDDDDEGESAAYVEITRRAGDSYIRARLGFTTGRGEPGKITVYSRGIRVGRLPASEVMGDVLPGVTGVLDSNMFDLQLDRNRLLTNPRLKKFQDRVRIWFCDALAAWSAPNWPHFVEAVTTHRGRLLDFLFRDPEATAILGPHIPFEDAGDPGHPRPLSTFLDKAITSSSGKRTCPYASRYTEGHPALTVFARRGQPVLKLDLYVPTSQGKANLDLVFVRDFCAMTHKPIAIERVDQLLLEVCGNDLPPERRSATLNRVLDEAQHHLQSYCDVVCVALGDSQLPGVVATTPEQVSEEETPGAGRHDIIARLIEALGDDAQELTLPEGLLSRRSSNRRATVLLNIDHRPLARTIEQVPLDRAASGLALIAATMLLRSTSLDDPHFLPDLHRLIYDLCR